ncbi:MAG TPA: DUF748 domain-containing protein, partial [Thermoanaerobaculia bacterium]|nr:DUF748 domain-containing protein [Thermoanaerobaculia bacterium]
MSSERSPREKRSVPERGHSAAEHPKKGSILRIGRGVSKTALWTVGIIVGLVVLLFIASFFVDEPMRRAMERSMNQKLTGYSVTLPKLHFRLIGLSVTLHDLTIRQKENPEPPVAVIPRLHASLHWREIFSGHLVSDFFLDHPRIHVNLPQLQKEAKDPTPIKDKGWQEAALAIYPFKINLLRVSEADFVYIDKDPSQPLHLSHLNFRASNIRNIHSKDRAYPSPIHADGVIFDEGKGVIDGNADFLAEPFAGVHVLYKVEKVPLDRFRSLLERSANMSIKGGVLASEGELEYAPKAKLAHVKDVSIDGLHLDFIHTTATAPKENAVKRDVKEAAKKASNNPNIVLKLDKFELLHSTLGLINRATTPDYRIFVSGADLRVTNLSNHAADGLAHAKLTGKFMGSGSSVATASFRPENKMADLSVDIAIENTDLTKMNDLLRAYGKFDVTQGEFGFYSQLRIKNNHIEGYVKPLISGMKVYDPEQDKEKSFFHKLYEEIVGGVAKLLESHKTNDVATQANISGEVGSASASVWQVIGKLFENAFIKAILPGFDRVTGHT